MKSEADDNISAVIDILVTGAEDVVSTRVMWGAALVEDGSGCAFVVGDAVDTFVVGDFGGDGDWALVEVVGCFVVGKGVVVVGCSVVCCVVVGVVVGFEVVGCVGVVGSSVVVGCVGVVVGSSVVVGGSA